MRVDLISSCTYRACLPDDPNCLSYYGSEPYAAVLLDSLSKRNKDWEFHWYAPVGSTSFDDRDNVTFHPLLLDFGKASLTETLREKSVEGLVESYLLKSDFIIDHSANAMNIELLIWYFDFEKFVCYRNGYAAFNFPRVQPHQTHFVVPSKQNQQLFKQNGFASIYAYYGIPEFYKPGFDQEYWKYFEEKYKIVNKQYILFLHRPTVDKGIDKVVRLAKESPKNKIVIAGAAGIAEHQKSLLEAKRQKVYQDLDNLIFVDIPLNPKHHYYERELYRNAAFFLSPFEYPRYIEGFGLSTASCIACGTPALITDSPSTRELWIEGKDALYIDGFYAMKYAVENISSQSLKPENKFSVDDYAKKYEEMANLYNTKDT
jgi:glycosyltransferase involved in cell wall biosynthesis